MAVKLYVPSHLSCHWQSASKTGVPGEDESVAGVATAIVDGPFFTDLKVAVAGVETLPLKPPLIYQKLPVKWCLFTEATSGRTKY